MVRLSFVEYAPAPLHKVWQYFSVFQNIVQWDPNTKKVAPKTNKAGMAGSTYKLITLWKGDESQFDYEITEITKNSKFAARGQNGTTSVIDEIYFKQKGGGTEITYVADICLKHVLKVMTPCIKADLDKLALDAQQGMRAKIKQLYG